MVTENNIEELAQDDLGYGQLFRILLRRWLWFLGVLGGAVVVTFILTLREEPTFQSSMQLLVEPNYPRSQNLVEVGEQAGAESEEDYATQINLMRSREFVQKAVEALRAEYPDLDTDTAFRSLRLAQVTEDGVKTRIFQADFTSNDPVKSQRFLQALLKIYQDYNLEQQELRLNRGLAIIDKQLQESRRDLTEAQQNLEQFLSRNALFQPEQQGVGILESLTQAQQEQQNAFVEYEDAMARFTALQQQIALTPQAALLTARLSQSPRYQALLGELQTTDLELAQRQVIYSDNDPGVQALLERRRNQLALLQSEITRVVGNAAPNSNQTSSFLNGSPLSPTDLDLVNQMVALRSTLLGLSARSRSLNQVESQLRAELSQFPRLIAEYDRLRPEVESEQSKLQQLLTLRQELSARLAQGGFTWQVVEQPVGGWKTGPEPRRNLLLGLAVGTFLGGAAAFLREITDTVIRSTSVLQEHSKFALLGSIPDAASVNKKALPHSQLIQSNDAWNAGLMNLWFSLRESFDFAHSNIQYLSEPGSLNSLVITSTVVGEGKTTIAIGLALSAARLHQRVLLIDANLRQPLIHQMLQIPNETGLTSILSEEVPDTQPQSVNLAGLKLDVLPSGPMVEDSVKLLSSYQMKNLLAEYESSYDLILVDSPECLTSLDATQLAAICRGVLFVARLNAISKPELTEAIARLRKFKVIGMLANFVRK